MKIAIYGAGSLGTVLGAFLSKQPQFTVHLYSRNQAHVEALNAYGATVIGTLSMNTPVKAYLPLWVEHLVTLPFTPMLVKLHMNS